MVEMKTIKIVKEDAIVGNDCKKSIKEYKQGYDNFVYPYTVSFCDEGKYEVVIKEKKAMVRKVE